MNEGSKTQDAAQPPRRTGGHRLLPLLAIFCRAVSPNLNNSSIIFTIIVESDLKRLCFSNEIMYFLSLLFCLSYMGHTNPPVVLSKDPRTLSVFIQLNFKVSMIVLVAG